MTKSGQSMGRIRTDLDEEEQDKIEEYQEEYGLQKKKANTDIVKAGVNLQHKREEIKQVIVDFFEDEEWLYNLRKDSLKKRYDIENIKWIEGTMNAEMKGNEYQVQGVREVLHINGKNKKRKLCPECGKEDYSTNNSAPGNEDEKFYECNNCGHEYDQAERELRVPKEDLEQIKEFATKRYNLFKDVEGRLVSTLEYIMGNSTGISDIDWLHPGTLQFDNGFQTVTMPFFCTDKERIRFYVNERTPDYEEAKSPVQTAGLQGLSDDYRRLLRNIGQANRDADKVTPMVIDEYGYHEKPKFIEVWGIEQEELEEPFRDTGYKVEKVDLSPPEEYEDQMPEQEEESSTAKPISHFKVTTDKAIYEEDEDGE